MAQPIQVNAVPLIAGMLGAPFVANTIARSFITPKENIATEAEADAEFKRMLRNFAIFDALLAVGLGYAAARATNVGTTARSALFGGALGAGLVATTFAAALISGPSRPEPTRTLQPLAGSALLLTPPATGVRLPSRAAMGVRR